MRKLFMFLASFMAMLPMYASPQDDDFDMMPDVANLKNNAFFIGPKVGGLMSTMTQPSESKLYDGADFGFSGGLAMKLRFGKAFEESNAGTGFFGVGAEVKYMLNSVKTIGTDESGKENAKMSLGSVEVPVFVQVYPFAKVRSMNSFYVELGASFGAIMSRSPKSLTVMNPNEEYSQVIYNLDSNGSKLKGGMISPMAGIGYTIPNTGLDINARYYIGVNELAGNFPCKISSLEISIAWLFKLPF